MGNRTFDKIKMLENEYCKAFRLESLTEMLGQSDVVITATSAPHYIIGPQHVPHNKTMQIFDLAVPRDVNPLVKAFDNISLYSVHDIEAQINQNLQLRSEKILLAEEIIENEVQRFISLQNPKL
jgi:glutamyl-tRNA reductase